MLSLDSKQLILESPVSIQLGVWTDPHLIGQDGSDPLDHFVGDFLGYARMGSIQVRVTREFAEFLVGVMQRLIRKDAIRKTFRIQLDLAQFGIHQLSVVQQGLRQLDYPVTGSEGDKIININHIGPQEETCSIATFGLLLKFRTVGCKNLFVAMYNATNVTEESALAPSGTEYATTTAIFEALEHPAFASEALGDQRSYGAIWDEELVS